MYLLFPEIKEKVNKKPKVEKKEPEGPKMPKIPLMDPKSVRANAKKALFQTLWKRYNAQYAVYYMYMLNVPFYMCFWTCLGQ